MTSPAPPPTATPDQTGRHVAQYPEKDRSQSSYVLAIVGLIGLLLIGSFLLWQLLSGPDQPDTPVLVQVPAVAGLDRNEAADLLQEQNLGITFREETSTDVLEDIVIRSDPAEGEEVEPGTRVTLYISTGPEESAIPNVSNLDIEAARKTLADAGFAVGQETLQDSQDFEEGIVISQSLPAGTKAAPGTTIDLVVSSGPRFLTMPNLENVPATTAQEELTRLGFTDIVVEQDFDNEMLEGFVIRTEPGASQLAERDTTVTIYVSKGPEPFPLQDLTGRSIPEAQALASERGLSLVVDSETVDVTQDSGLVGMIAAQTPSAGTEVVFGDEIHVKLGVLRQVQVPDLVGMSETDARAALLDRGLTLNVTGTVEVPADSGLEGVVAAQSPDAGTSVDDGSVVSVAIGVVTPTTEPPPDTGGGGGEAAEAAEAEPPAVTIRPSRKEPPDRRGPGADDRSRRWCPGWCGRSVVDSRRCL